MVMQYIFHCPEHGKEAGVFCWRAFQGANVHLWKKYSLVEVKFDDGELEAMIKNHW